ncbi:protein amnionless [Aricia agestis]|uniref:protein amnionless n=1 Tax=Aricia agestis TaxID=91739 RepID=UPI001C2063AD|nr:protein amnionless [Aricia agestis]
MNAYFLSAFFIGALHCVTPATVKWLPNTSFNLPTSFKNGKLPCPKQTVVFPESTINAIEIDSDISISELVLPMEGELLFGNAEVSFGPSIDSNCTDDGNVFYLEKSISSWAQPDVWSSPKFNEATPDAERIPCFEDIVEFPEKAQFSLLLPDQTQRVREIRIAGVTLGHEEQVLDFVSMSYSGPQQFVLNKFGDLGLEVRLENCKSVSGCPCQNEILKVDCSSKFCPKPTCVNPIQPVGHCCKICGGSILFGIDKSFDLLSFEEFVDSIVSSYGKEGLVYHIGRLPDDRVQVVVVDKGEYSGTSAVVINDISHKMEKHSFHETLLSGSPLDEAGVGGRTFVTVLLLVVAFMGTVYLYYYKVPDVRLLRSGVLRYNQRSESVVSLTRRDSGVGVNTGLSRASFRNPLYDSKRQRVIVEESTLEDE